MHYLTNFYVFNSLDKYLLRQCALCGESRITNSEIIYTYSSAGNNRQETKKKRIVD